MKQTKHTAGVYLIEGVGTPFMARFTGTCWVANDATTEEECADTNNWGVAFPTKKALIAYAKSF